jgi:hypothetical protein
MNATGIPPAAPAAPVTAAPVSALAQPTGNDVATNDFVGMLMQLVGGAAPNTKAGPAIELTTQTTNDDIEDPEALAAMLAMPLPMLPPPTLPWAAQPAAASDSGVDPLELLGLGGGANKNGSNSLLDLTNALADTAATIPELDGDQGMGSISPFNEVQQARSASAEAVAARTLHAPVGTDRWAEELGNRLTLMVDRTQQTASLRLSPEHLGPLEVRISITDDKASVWFGAVHADTRAAIEQALPRLREMFTAQGLSLTDTGVFHEPPREQTPPRNNFLGEKSSDAGQEGEVRIITRSIGLFDAYA